MAVYVDDAKTPYGRMLMSHMIADTDAELAAAATRLGLPTLWLQPSIDGRAAHFYVCQSKRGLAIELGAIPISQRELARRLRRGGDRG